MSFGIYRPSMGVAGGHRETCADLGHAEQRKRGEHMRRQEINPITGEASGESKAMRRPPSGNLRSGLVPASGPMDHVTANLDRDVPAKRTDPTKNQSSSLTSGGAVVPIAPDMTRSVPSRVTEGMLGEGFSERARTPERRLTPGQVVRGNSRPRNGPKDSLYGGCVTGDRQDHPTNLPRKAGSAGPVGGAVHLVAGPTGFVPCGPGGAEEPVSYRSASPQGAQPFRRMVGVGH